MPIETPTQAAPARSLYRDRRFLLIWLAQIISGIGDYALLLAIPVTVYNGTGSPVLLSFAVVSETLPALLLGLFAGVLADRIPRRQIMILTDLGRMAAVLLLLNLHRFQHLHRSDLYLIYGVGFLTSSFSCFFGPARAALLPSLLSREQLLEANSLLTSGSRLSQIAGPGFGATLLLWLHPRGLFLFDALTFLVSAVCLAFVAENFRPREGRKGVAGVWADLREGLQIFLGHPILGALIGLMSLTAFFGGIYNALLYAFARDVLHVHGSGFGYLLVGVGVGALCALPLIAGPLKKAPAPRLLAAGLLGMAATGWMLAFAPNVAVGAVAMFLGGFSNMLMYLPITTLFQTAGPPSMLGRVYGAAVTLGAFFAAASGLAAAGITSVFPHLKTLYALLPFAYLISGFLAVPLLTRPDAESPPDALNSEENGEADKEPVSAAER